MLTPVRREWKTLQNHENYVYENYHIVCVDDIGVGYYWRVNDDVSYHFDEYYYENEGRFMAC
ncbi:hypothetical protein QCA50_017695 [Cerrena zonata]|uniref:Uncharacterized protein n=1 Tax=Cerrena zonata TaxID=2478898 RepID=A0AAW0FP39_9APHY